MSLIIKPSVPCFMLFKLLSYFETKLAGRNFPLFGDDTHDF